MNDKNYFLDKKENVRIIYLSTWLVGLILILCDLIIHRHDDASFAEFFGFYGIYGFLGCVILVLMAKAIRKLVMRSEDYYDR